MRFFFILCLCFRANFAGLLVCPQNSSRLTVEETLLKSLAQSGPAFLLLGYVVYVLLTLLRTQSDRIGAMVEQLVASNLALTSSLKSIDEARAEQRTAHAEQTLLSKMTLDKLAEHIND